MDTHMYTDMADWWPMLSAASEYEEEAGIFTRAFLSALPVAKDGRPTLLELGSGGGNNASHMKKHFQITLVDLSADMLEVSRRINPDLPHHQGDMRSFRIDQEFDAVFIHDAIMYMTSEEDLLRAISNAYAHTRPGGAALFVPDHVRETFQPQTSHGGHDGEKIDPRYAGKAMRYLEWTREPAPHSTAYLTDYVYLLHEEGQPVRCIHDQHTVGLFPRQTWLDLMQKAGFQPEILPFDHSEVEPGETELFLGRKPV